MDNPQTNMRGDKFWFNSQGQVHRDNGPAIEFAHGGCSWMINGLAHREDGPAIEYATGEKYWYINGVWIQ
jgi:hypothetical protein